MSTRIKTLSTSTLAAALTLGAATFGAAPAAADPSGNSTCTARTVSGTATEVRPFGAKLVSGFAQSYAEDPNANFGQDWISDEARYDRDDCGSFTPGP